MNKQFTILTGGIVILLTLLYVGIGTEKSITLGGMDAHPSYYEGFDSTASISGTATTTNAILTASSSRTNAKVCHRAGTSTVYLHKRAISTTTGVNGTTGIPLYPNASSSFGSCRDFPGFKGYLFGITDAVNSQNVSTTQTEWR